MAHVIVEREIAGRKLRLETGKWAKQAAGAVVASMGESVVLAATAEQPIRPGFDFFPLTVDYREKGYAAGLIFGGRFRKREGAPSEKETLTMRLIDRPIRPLWPEGFTRDVLIQCIALSAAPEVDPDVLAMIAAAASLSVSTLPFQGPTGSVRVAQVAGELVLFPTHEQTKSAELDLFVSGTKKAVLMVEAAANELPEERMIEAIQFGHRCIQDICAMVDEMVAQVNPKKETFTPPAQPAIFALLLKEHAAEFNTAAWTPTKFGRHAARADLTQKLVERYARKPEETDARKPSVDEVHGACDHAWEKTIRRMIVNNKRCDGRSRTDIRPISCEVGVLPRTHGSALFTRGETQALVTTTLGTASDEQIVESLMGEFNDRFLLHYNFPSFCVGEVKMPRGPSRRDIGHGALARRGLKAVLPEYLNFPYTVRVVSEILESNGSSSMASVCGGTLALLDAGVPLKAPVAGIAMGLVEEDGQYAILSDILGDEDHYGDMDFKVAGTAKGVTALQMDLKSGGVPYAVMQKALDQALEGRKHILNQMFQVIATHRPNISQHAPKIVQLKIAVDKIGKLIGPGGKNIRGLEEKYAVKIEVNDDGQVVVASPKRDQAEQCALVIEALTGTPEVGKVYMGEVVNIKEFGVFFEIMPGLDGMCHVSELDVSYVKNPADFCKIGDQMQVKLIAVDDLGRLKLSRKALLVPAGEAGAAAPGDAAPKPEGERRGNRERDRSEGRRGR